MIFFFFFGSTEPYFKIPTVHILTGCHFLKMRYLTDSNGAALFLLLGFNTVWLQTLLSSDFTSD